jgi:hypothetical protein
MVRERKLDQRNKTHETTLARSHFFAHHPRMTVAKKKNQASPRDSVRTQVRRSLNDGSLSALQVLQKNHRSFEERQTRAARAGGWGLIIHGEGPCRVI